MDISKIFDIINNNDINQEEVFALVDEAKKMDLDDEDSIRNLIKKGCLLTGKHLDKEKEDKLVETIKEQGIGPNLLEIL